MRLFVESTKKPGLRYEVVDYDADTKKAILVGPMGCPFPRTLIKPELEKLGYKLVKEMDDAQQPELQA